MSLLQFTPIIRLITEMCYYNLELQLERQVGIDRVRRKRERLPLLTALSNAPRHSFLHTPQA